MGRKRHKPEEIVAKLRQVDVMTTQGQTVAEAIRSIGVTEVAYYLYGRLSRCEPILIEPRGQLQTLSGVARRRGASNGESARTRLYSW